MYKFKLIIPLVFLFAGLLISTSSFSQTSEVLDNEGIINLVNSGMPGSIIIKKIMSSPNRFDLSTDGLIKLSKANVPEEIIGAMMESEGRKVSDYYGLTKKFDKAGIYLLKGEIGSADVTYLEPSVIDKTKEGNFGSHMAGALTTAAKKKVKAIIAGSKSNTMVDNKPVFVFYFGDESGNNSEPAQPVNQNDPMAMIRAMQNMSIAEKVEFSTISSPNEVRLVMTEVSSKERSFVASASSGMTKESGIDSDYVRDFKFEKLAPGLYKVFFDNPLEKGEYLFVPAGIILGQGQYIYDFSVE
ncbi:MAG: hypothetical protein AB9834_05900 [Lentimicrobium sp.]